MIKAVIDTGTNSTRLLVARVDGKKKYEELTRITTITRLGEGIADKKEILPHALRRTLEVISSYIEIAKKQGAEKIDIFGTQVLREAKNRNEVIDFIEKATGLKVNVLSGDEEAYYSFTGASSDLPEELNKLVVDVGGGSTEIAVGREKPHFLTSLKIGCVRLKELYHLENAVTKEKAEEIVLKVKEEIKAGLLSKNFNDALTGVFVGGTATTIAAVSLNLTVYERRLVHLTRVGFQKIKEIAFTLSSLSLEERARFKVIEPARLEVISAGALILLALAEHFNLKEIIVSEKDILDGYLLFGS